MADSRERQLAQIVKVPPPPFKHPSAGIPPAPNHGLTSTALQKP